VLVREYAPRMWGKEQKRRNGGARVTPELWAIEKKRRKVDGQNIKD
jgi:hypothetical protein